MAQADTPHPLIAALWELFDTVSVHPDQTVYRLAEQSVLAWTGFVEGKGQVQPRLSMSGFVPTGFHFGMELNQENQLDSLALNEELDRYLELLTHRQERLRAALERFFHHTGYRNSTDQCDQLMVELSLYSRFLGAACLEVERAQGGAPGALEHPKVDVTTGAGHGGLLFEVRFQFFYWEPLLNDSIVAWQQNSLPDYLRALQRLREALTVPSGKDRALPYEAGYPVRSQSRPRIKVIAIRPEGRPLRGQSMLELRLTQLIRRIDAHPGLPLRVVMELEREIRQCIHMTQSGSFVVATEPSFQHMGRQALSLIRTKPSVHPFLLDTTEFFKKALLFFNGTYTIAGGGIDPMYLQIRQLERYYRFENWGSARGVRGPLEASIIAWEENRWHAFTAGVLRVAELVRGDAAA